MKRSTQKYHCADWVSEKRQAGFLILLTCARSHLADAKTGRGKGAHITREQDGEVEIKV